MQARRIQSNVAAFIVRDQPLTQIHLQPLLLPGPTFTAPGHEDFVFSLGFSPDDKFIITASADGIARQYFAYLDELLDYAGTPVTRGFTPGEVEAYQISPPPSCGLLKWPILGGLGAGTSASSACAGTRP